jgi:hypothetical protein
MHGHKIDFLRGLAQEVSCPFQHVAVGRAVKAEAADVVFLSQAGWDGIEGSDIRNGAVEGCVEDGVKGSSPRVRRIGSINSTELLLCSGARRSKLWISRTTSGVIFVASEKFLPPCTTLIPVR